MGWRVRVLQPAPENKRLASKWALTFFRFWAFGIFLYPTCTLKRLQKSEDADKILDSFSEEFMCSYEDRMRTVQFYLKLGRRLAATPRQLAYPTKNSLLAWCAEFE